MRKALVRMGVYVMPDENEKKKLGSDGHVETEEDGGIGLPVLSVDWSTLLVLVGAAVALSLLVWKMIL
ncbi:MAG: hypothetical protein IKO41_09865 [Lachnospiraceae bacterium]|nr:hypothetical protein [Lachnospiraceae bacterium]